MKFTFAPESRPLAGYTIKRAIDRGGFGEVYYAQSDAGKEVALKLLQHNLDVELRGIAQCINLKHPNLVAIFDVRSDDDGDQWVVMEYVAGKTLEQALADYPHGMPMELIQKWMHGVVGGLAYLHDRGLVHRDVKPGNIFWDGGVVKVGDVGLSKFITPSRRSAHTESVGTVYYMAPEVAHGRYGAEVDVYSLGVILYEMLTGRVPFDGESTGEILMKHLSTPPDLTQVPERMRPVLAHALHKDPRCRTQSALQLLDEFNRAVRGESIATEIPPESFVRATRVEVIPERRTAPPPPSATIYPTAPKFVSQISKNLTWLAERHPILTGVIACLMLLVMFGPVPFAGPLLLATIGLALVGASSLHRDKRSQSYAGRPQLPPVVSAPPPPPPPPPPRQPVQPAAYKTERPRRVSPLVLNPATYRRVPMRQRLADLSVSMTWAVVVSIIFTAVTSFLTPLFGEPQQLFGDPIRIGMFTLVTIAAAWGILVVSKICEGRPLDVGTRRLIMLALGVAVGTMAFGVDQLLLVDLEGFSVPDASMFEYLGKQPLVGSGHQPTWLGYVVFFGSLLGIRGWWWHVDPLRSKRFSIGTLFLTGLAGFVIPLVFAFPQNWAIAWAGVLSCVVQVSAAWIPADTRAALVENNRVV
ncbi:MAG TPA: serine/threonine-protein kinase [Planctomycetaceae bacterium]|nr:serine/threonine-protein kinase [Planctomycetaceae bacterium]